MSTSPTSTDLTAHKKAIAARLDALTAPGFYAYFHVSLARPRKGQPRQINVAWVAYPFEETVREALGDLDGGDIVFTRNRLWTCGQWHEDSLEAWKVHEGSQYLEFSDDHHCCGGDEQYLPDDVADELRAAGETFESACRPGNYVACPTCGGTARVVSDRRTFTVEPCPDCVRLGADQNPFMPGILDLDNPEHLAFYESALATAHANAEAKTTKATRKRKAALSVPTSTAAPTWLPLPTRDAELLNGIPVAPVVGCDHLNHANDPDRRVLCRNEARWFDPTTGLRVCTRHKRSA